MNTHRFSALPANRTSLGARAHQRGSVLVAAGAALLVSVILLASADLGYLFYAKREFQKTADLAALAGAQQIQIGGCSAATAAAVGNANLNLQRFGVALPTTPAPVECGRWDPNPDPTQNTVAQRDPTTESYGGSGGQMYFGTPGTVNGLPVNFNAVRVTVQQTLPGLLPFTGNHLISVNAIAMDENPIATFSVGSKLLVSNSQTAPVCALLRIIGLNTCDFSILGYDGLAQLKITPGGLLQALGIPVQADVGVGELNTLLAARSVELGSLLDAVVTVAGRGDLLSANAQIVQAIEAQLGVNSLMVQLGSSDTKGGLFAQILAGGANANSALNAEVNVLDLITAGVGVGTGGHAVAAGLDIGNLLGLTASAKVSIVEPPSIGIGGVGTKAYTAQIRLYAKISTTSGGLLTGLLGLLGTQLNLPVVIDVVSSQGTLTAINCLTSPKTATIAVDSSLLKACIGQVDESTVFSTKDVCSTGLQSTTILSLLGINLLSGKVNVDPLAEPQASTTLEVGQTASVGQNQLAIGTTVSQLVSQLLALVLAQQPTSGSGTGTQLSNLPPDVATQVADKYLNQYNYNVSKIDTQMKADGLTWPRPCLLGLGTCAMPDAWQQSIPILGCNSSCVRTSLINSLQTTAGGGLLSGILNGVGNLLSTILTGQANSTPQNLLQSILMPVVNLLSPLLNAVGATLANLLNTLLGIDLGVTDVNLRALSCGAPRLVY